MNRFFFPCIAGIITVLLLTTAPGCNDRLPTEPTGSVIMPLAKGNMWIGTLTTYAEDGSVIGTEPDTIAVTEQRLTTIHDGTGNRQHIWYRCKGLSSDSLPYWYRNGDEGLLQTTEDGLSAIENQQGNCTCLSLIARYPAQTGDTSGTAPKAKVLIPNPDDPANPLIVDQIIARYVESTDTAVIVPAGSYRCHLYYLKLISPDNARFAGSTPWQYMVPDIGPVKIEWYEGGSPATGRMTKKWELVETHLN